MNRNDLVKNVKEYILTLDIFDLKDLNVGQVAKIFDINACFLSRKFKECNNMLLSDYIDFIKISQAIHLVKNRNDMKIDEISNLIGIKKRQTFREKFKKFYGINPNELRDITRKMQKKTILSDQISEKSLI